MSDITAEYLRKNKNEIFVFGDNLLRKGKKGAAALRDEPNTYGFITKKEPNNNKESFYKPKEYENVYKNEISELIHYINLNDDKTFLISKLGSGLANKNKIFEQVIEPNIKNDLKGFKNVKFLW